jgi:hypothetical protein
MEPRQARRISGLLPPGSCQLTLLGLWSRPPRPHIHDPHTLSEAYWERRFDVIDSAVKDGIPEIRLLHVLLGVRQDEYGRELMGICLTQNGYNARSGTRGNTERAKPVAAVNPVTVTPGAPKSGRPDACRQKARSRHFAGERSAPLCSNSGADRTRRLPERFFRQPESCRSARQLGSAPPPREHGQAEFEKMAEFGVASAGARVIRRGLGPSGLFVMLPKWMQMQLHIVSGSGDPAGDSPVGSSPKKAVCSVSTKKVARTPNSAKLSSRKPRPCSFPPTEPSTMARRPGSVRDRQNYRRC